MMFGAGCLTAQSVIKTRDPEKLPEAFSLFSYTVWINLTVYEQKGLVTALDGSHFIHISKSV